LECRKILTNPYFVCGHASSKTPAPLTDRSLPTESGVGAAGHRNHRDPESPPRTPEAPKLLGFPTLGVQNGDIPRTGDSEVAMQGIDRLPKEGRCASGDEGGATLRPTMPDLPAPGTTTRPVASRIAWRHERTARESGARVPPPRRLPCGPRGGPIRECRWSGREFTGGALLQDLLTCQRPVLNSSALGPTAPMKGRSSQPAASSQPQSRTTLARGHRTTLGMAAGSEA
jgi:hypothetical protein